MIIFFDRSFRIEYLRNIQSLTAHLTSASTQSISALLERRPSENTGTQRLLFYPVVETDLEMDNSLKPFKGLLDSLADGSLSLASEDLEDFEDVEAAKEDIKKELCGHSTGYYSRKRIQVYLAFVKQWLVTDSPLDQVCF